ncbi:MAG: phosphoenolpyruvate--protein phosphotransferase [Spirochaetaceae bacterium]|jgi:phosphotransferase system enzyme I (PtsI)|nr:phosphoenolpyruvate--protein phosphotransferase [Spirochaetaceae bacterium]
MRFEGTGASPGTALGRAVVFVHRLSGAGAPENPAGVFLGAEEELARFRGAVKTVHALLLDLAKEGEKKFGADKAGIFEGYAEILTDGEIEESARAFIAGGLSAAGAGQKIMEDLAGEWENMEGPYMAQRASDLRDLGRKLSLAASGGQAPELPVLSEPSILVADELSPFETAALDHRLLKALALDSGGSTGHAAILARSLGIPCAVGLGGASSLVKSGEFCALDGDKGFFILNPGQDEIEIFSSGEEGRAVFTPLPETVRTRDGVSISVCANIGSAGEAALAKERGADGVGLLRTEFLYMNSLPGEDEQYAAYARILEILDGKPLTIRTMDIGGDKEFPALALAREENPFLGYRAIRIGLKERGVFKTQLRAVLRASALGKTELMFPMIISPGELKEAKALFEECRKELDQEGLAQGRPPVGIMIETPAAALMAGELAAEADFFSLGTNDLTQYTLAVDRGNPQVASLYDPLNPAVLRLMAVSADAAAKAGIPAGICGELAGDEAALPLLLGLGLVKLSLSGPKIPLIKETIQKLDTDSCRALARKALSRASAGEVRALLQRFP